jgi:hypothetical protein
VRQIARTKARVDIKALLNTTFGNQELCTWQPGRGIVVVQTRLPRHARRMAQRRDSRLIGYGVAGGYLKTFEFRRSLAWAIRLMKRYMSDGKATNAAPNSAVCPVAGRASRTGRGERAELRAP